MERDEKGFKVKRKSKGSGYYHFLKTWKGEEVEKNFNVNTLSIVFVSWKSPFSVINRLFVLSYI